MEKTYSSSRINIIDILRGFALYGIILAHVGAVYLYESDTSSDELIGINNNIKRLLELFVERKFYLIFSFLFGLSFSIQLQKASQYNKPFALKYCWRLCILFFIGFLHNQLYPFDILQVYAIIGILLLPIRKLEVSTLLTIVVSLFLFGCLFFQFNDHIESVLLTGNFMHISLSRVLVHQIASGHFFIILSLFVLGLWAGKKNIFSHQGIKTTFFKTLFFCCAAILVGLRIINSIIDISSINSLLINVSFSFLYISVICLLHKHSSNLKPLWLPLEAIGRMGLTNYILQTIFFYILFQHKNIFLKGDQLYLLFIYANLFFLFQAFISIAWFKRYKFGPLEWVWRFTTNLYKVSSVPQPEQSPCNAQHNI